MSLLGAMCNKVKIPEEIDYEQSTDFGLDSGRRFHNHLELVGFLGHLRELS
jgi:hypothetical protein